MIRLILFFLLALAVAILFVWVLDQNGSVTLDWSGYYIETDIGLAAIAIGLFVIAIIGIFLVLLVLLNLPSLTYRFIFQRRKNLGYDALSRGLIALGTGNSRESKKLGLYAEKLLKYEPAVQLLLAQAAQASGDQAEAQKRFEGLLTKKSTKLLGLHGLYIESIREKNLPFAKKYAEKAHKLSPKLPWASKAVLTFQANAGEWEDAVATLTKSFQSKLIDKLAYNRQKAVLMTALGKEIEMGEPDRARTLALESHKIAPSLVPAAVLAGRLCIRRGELRKATKILQTTWKNVPHPEIADTYAYLRHGDSVRDRYKRIQALAALRPNHSESSFALAKAAIEVQEFDEARAQLNRLIRSVPTQRAYLLMARVEETENGDQGSVREWLSRAVHAPRDFMWIADGVEYQEWYPVSPVSGKIDAFEWRKPVNKLPAPEIEVKHSMPIMDDSNKGDEKSSPMLKIADNKLQTDPNSSQENKSGAETGNLDIEPGPKIINQKNNDELTESSINVEGSELDQRNVGTIQRKSSVFSVKAPNSK